MVVRQLSLPKTNGSVTFRQHIRIGFWRCDLCAPTTDPNDSDITYYNDFNRKDLFTQHLRRMHATGGAGARHLTEQPVNEDNIHEHQERCYLQLRARPQRSTCVFLGCDREFSGPTSWEERLEHLAWHIEEAHPNDVDFANWKVDTALERYLMREDLIVWKDNAWKIGDGKNRDTEADPNDY